MSSSTGPWEMRSRRCAVGDAQWAVQQEDAQWEVRRGRSAVGGAQWEVRRGRCAEGGSAASVCSCGRGGGGRLCIDVHGLLVTAGIVPPSSSFLVPPSAAPHSRRSFFFVHRPWERRSWVHVWLPWDLPEIPGEVKGVLGYKSKSQGNLDGGEVVSYFRC